MDEGAAKLVKSVPLGEDLACMNCRYNLRTLSPSQNCPECAVPVADSIEHRRRLGVVDLRRLKSGAAILAGYGVAAGMWALFLSSIWWRIGLRPPLWADVVFTVAGNGVIAALLVAGIRRLRTTWPLGRRGKVTAAWCLMAAIFPAFVNLGWGVLTISGLSGTAHLDVAGAMEAMAVLAGVGMAAMCLAGVAYLFGLGKRLHWPGLTTLGIVIFILGAIHAVVARAAEVATVMVMAQKLSMPRWYYDLAMRLFWLDRNSMSRDAQWLWPLLVSGFWLLVCHAARSTERKAALAAKPA